MSDTFPEYTETVGHCEECGNSPVNHLLVRFSNDIDLVVSHFSKPSGAKKRQNSHSRSQAFVDWVAHKVFSGAYAIGILSYGNEPQDARSYRSRVIWEEAIRRGIEMQQMILLGLKTDAYRAKVDGAWIYFTSLPIPNEFKSDSQSWVDDKIQLKRVLTTHGIPVPEAVSVRTFGAAEKFMSRLGKPVVVKPRIGTRGRHTTVSVYESRDLRLALRSAKRLCSFVSLEEYLPGSVCRATVIDGKLVGFFQADPAIVFGDGKKSLSELLDDADSAREERVAPIVMTHENRDFLRRLGYTLDSVPVAGVRIPIGHRTGRLFGGSTLELLETVHPRLREYVERAAKALEISVVGFDLIIQNPESDPDAQRWGIIEANTLPFIDLHYLPLYGKPSNPASAIWDLWDKRHKK